MSERVLYSLVMALVVESAYFLNFFQPSDATTSSMPGSALGDVCPLGGDIVVFEWYCCPKNGKLEIPQVDSNPINSNSKFWRLELGVDCGL